MYYKMFIKLYVDADSTVKADMKTLFHNLMYRLKRTWESTVWRASLSAGIRSAYLQNEKLNQHRYTNPVRPVAQEVHSTQLDNTCKICSLSIAAAGHLWLRLRRLWNQFLMPAAWTRNAGFPLCNGALTKSCNIQRNTREPMMGKEKKKAEYYTIRNFGTCRHILHLSQKVSGWT
jgi:hypothetical protein